MSTKADRILVCILGPTAVGKTATAIRLAQNYQTEIISADSRQFYKEISIGTAKPDAQELDMVPHHFIGHIGITQTYTAGDFERDALAKLEDLFTKHRIVIAVGGSGLYVKALIEGLDDMPVADESLRTELNEIYRTQGISALQKKLMDLDENTYRNTEIQNPQRVMRAIEVTIAKQKGFISSRNKKERNFSVISIVLDLPREELYDRINQRVDRMIRSGLVSEARSVIEYRNTYALQTVGYKELFESFDGKYSSEKAIDLIRQHTRNYAKRQLTWFRKEVPENWLPPDHIREMIALIDQALSVD